MRSFGSVRLASTLLVLAAVGTSGCLSSRRLAVSDASEDLACPKKQLEVHTIGNGAYRATGCGRTATYQCGRAVLQFVPVTLACVQSSAPVEVQPRTAARGQPAE